MSSVTSTKETKADMALTEAKTDNLDLPPCMEDWSTQQVREWALNLKGVDQNSAEILFIQEITGASLKLLNDTDLNQMCVKVGPAKVILHARDEIIKGKRKLSHCQPYPFDKHQDPYRYIEGNILNITETGAFDLIEPCHEFKALNNTTEETIMTKFTDDVIRYAASCMNCSTNGTIHCGIGDTPNFIHGQVIGVTVKNKMAFGEALTAAIKQRFKLNAIALRCIRPPRFVEVLHKDMTTSDKFVIEVDIIPDSKICMDNYFITNDIVTTKLQNGAKKITKTKQCFVRDGSSSRNLLAPSTFDKKMYDFKRLVDNMQKQSELRKQAEDSRLRVIKNHNQDSKLCEMITGGTGSLDDSYYQQYIIVTNKSHPIHLDSMSFLVELDPAIVFDFDPQSHENGLFQYLKKYSSEYSGPDEYKSTGAVQKSAEKFTRWLQFTEPWIQKEKVSFQKLISLFCQKNRTPNRKCLIVFLLLSRVSEQVDPLVETFCSFYQELKSTAQFLCICDSENTFTSWKNLIKACCEVEISNRCIYELSFTEVNGTILSLFSENRRSSRFLPCGGGSKVVFEEEMESSLTTLDVLCVNQCEGGTEDDVSWFIFYYSEQSGPWFVKRNKFAYIVETLIPELCNQRKACVLFNLLHVPGCGGTTLAKHTLWALRKTFRCAVLTDSSADPATVVQHVVTLLKCGCVEQEPPVPVLLMIDDFEDMDQVLFLQQMIEKQCLESNLPSTFPQVILLNCMRSEPTPGPFDPNEDTVYIRNDLSEDQQKLFDRKVAEIERTHTNAKIFLAQLYQFFTLLVFVFLNFFWFYSTITSEPIDTNNYESVFDPHSSDLEWE